MRCTFRSLFTRPAPEMASITVNTACALPWGGEGSQEMQDLLLYEHRVAQRKVHFCVETHTALHNAAADEAAAAHKAVADEAKLKKKAAAQAAAAAQAEAAAQAAEAAQAAAAQAEAAAQAAAAKKKADAAAKRMALAAAAAAMAEARAAAGVATRAAKRKAIESIKKAGRARKHSGVVREDVEAFFGSTGRCGMPNCPHPTRASLRSR